MREVAIDRSSTAERMAEALRVMMFEGELAAGEALREVALASSFGVSRTTAREALQILALEGLVTRVPNRGAEVTELSAADIDEIFRARRILETAGVRAVTEASKGALDGLRTAIEDYEAAASSGDHSASTEAHLRFHNALVGLLDSRRLLDTAASLTSDLRLALATVGRLRRDAPEQVAEHRRLLDLVVAADVDRAVAELASHLTKAKASLVTRTERRTQSQTSNR